MKIEVSISKRHFAIILAAILALGVFGLVYAFGTNNPSSFGHSVGEVDWSQPIESDVSINGILSIGGQQALRSDNVWINVGDLVSGDGLRGLILRAGDADRMIITQGGDVGIGTLTPGQKLDVNGNIFSTGKVYNSNTCRKIFGHSQGGTQKGKVSVPTECLDNTCLIGIVESSRVSFVHYREGAYDFGGASVHAWASSRAGKNAAMYDAQSEEVGINGDSVSTIILSSTTLSSGQYQIYLYDDGTESGQEINALEWSWKSIGTGFDLYVCN